jgi:hypothetical protein
VTGARLRVALLLHTVGSPPEPGVQEAAVQTARALAAREMEVRVLSSDRRPTRVESRGGVEVVRSARLPEAPLRRRGFTGPLTHGPLTLRALERGGYDVVQAFTPEDAWIALTWRRRSGLPVVFTAAEPVGRDSLADRRLRLRLVQDAFEASDAVTAVSDDVAATVARWLAVDARVIAPGDGAGHAGLYSDLIARRTR